MVRVVSGQGASRAKEQGQRAEARAKLNYIPKLWCEIIAGAWSSDWAPRILSRSVLVLWLVVRYEVLYAGGPP